ncbi:hypothetical protein BGZ72_004921 [Mortierella alpina]|nr:hypothetical protein BGZ72_004921 [Mortierella alpina]
MVKLALSFAALAAMAATVASAPLSQSPLRSQFSFDEPNKCIPETDVFEYRPFYLNSYDLKSPVSKEQNGNVLVGGITGDVNLNQLEMCIVSTDYGCSQTIPSNCIFQNVEYRFRVNSPVKGYLKVVDGVVEIVSDFNSASELNLYKEEGWGLRVAQRNPDNSRNVFSTTIGGSPLILEKPIADKAKQWFKIIASHGGHRGYPSGAPSTRNQCIPETTIKEYRPFSLLSSQLNTLVSKPYKYPFLVGGVSGSKAFQELQFCIVSSPQECSTTIPANCIYDNVEYRFRVSGPAGGYLKIRGDALEIVRDFKDASGLNLYKQPGWGLRVAHINYDGSRSILATNGGGRALRMEEFKANDPRQWFRIIEESHVEEELSPAPFEPNQCVPETTIKEYHPFALRSSKLNTLVASAKWYPFLVGGVRDDKDLEGLEFCIVSSNGGCSKSIPSNCIYQNVEYRFRVNGPVEGYLRITGDIVEIVREFKDASGLNLYKQPGWGLRVAHINKDGSRSVFATNGEGIALSVEKFKADDARQWFQIIEPKTASTPYRRF